MDNVNINRPLAQRGIYPTHRIMLIKRTLLGLFFALSCILSSQAQVVITEIMYNPPESGTDSLEYIELYNAGTTAVNMEGYKMDGVTYTFPAGATLAAGAYTVLVKSNTAMQAVFGRQFVQWTDGALTNGGERIRLLDAANNVLDEVSYTNLAPWPLTPNGEGPSLVLCDPKSDNSLPASWQAATTGTGKLIAGKEIFGNPGAASRCEVRPSTTTYPRRTIAQMTTENATTGAADSLGRLAELQGVVLGNNLRAAGLEFTLSDAPNNVGISVFRAAGNVGYTATEGDEVIVRGRISQFNGLTQITADTVIRVGTGRMLPTPAAATRLSEATESKLLRIMGLKLLNPAQWTTGSGSGGFTVTAVSGTDTVAIRVNASTTAYNMPSPGTNLFNLVGIGSQFDNSSPWTSGYQIIPRSASDVQVQVSNKEVNYSDQVSMWPNPVQSMLHIRTSMSFERIVVYNVQGIPVCTVQHPTEAVTVHVADLPVGLYVVRFERGATFWATTLLKQ